MKFEDLTGRRFERLFVVERTTGNSKKHTYWKCMCDCGKEVVTTSQKLKRGNAKSCGCYSRDRATKHGQWNSRLYHTWRNMKSRCDNPNATAHNRYGGRGIEVCDEWRDDYIAFRDWALAHGYDESDPHGQCTIDRIDVNGNYCPENCRVVDMKVQCNNTSSNRIIEHNGENHTLSEWAELLGIHKNTLSNRLSRGWSIERAFSQSVQKRKTCV